MVYSEPRSRFEILGEPLETFGGIVLAQDLSANLQGHITSPIEANDATIRLDDGTGAFGAEQTFGTGHGPVSAVLGDMKPVAHALSHGCAQPASGPLSPWNMTSTT